MRLLRKTDYFVGGVGIAAWVVGWPVLTALAAGWILASALFDLRAA